MKRFSALLAICAGNSLVTSEFPAQRTVMWSFDVFFDLRLNKRLSKQSWGWWFETLSHPLWRHCNDTAANLSMWNIGNTAENPMIGYKECRVSYRGWWCNLAAFLHMQKPNDYMFVSADKDGKEYKMNCNGPNRPAIKHRKHAAMLLKTLPLGNTLLYQLCGLMM